MKIKNYNKVLDILASVYALGTPNDGWNILSYKFLLFLLDFDVKMKKNEAKKYKIKAYSQNTGCHQKTCVTP